MTNDDKQLTDSAWLRHALDQLCAELAKKEHDPLPWLRREPNVIVNGDGLPIFHAVRFDQQIGHTPSNDNNALILEWLSVIAAHLQARGAAERAAFENSNRFELLQQEVVAWADAVMPNRTPVSAFLKLFEEVGELVRNPSSPAEYADILIMLLDLAHMHNIDLLKAGFNKLALNRLRRWELTQLGTLQHLQDSESSNDA